MPAPAVVAIPWLATIIGSVIGGLITFFGKFLTKKLAILSAVLVVAVSATGAFILAIEGLMVGIAYAKPTLGNWFVFVPDNFSACIGAIISAHLVKWAYWWHMTVLQWKLF